MHQDLRFLNVHQVKPWALLQVRKSWFSETGNRLESFCINVWLFISLCRLDAQKYTALSLSERSFMVREPLLVASPLSSTLAIKSSSLCPVCIIRCPSNISPWPGVCLYQSITLLLDMLCWHSSCASSPFVLNRTEGLWWTLVLKTEPE